MTDTNSNIILAPEKQIPPPRVAEDRAPRVGMTVAVWVRKAKRGSSTTGRQKRRPCGRDDKFLCCVPGQQSFVLSARTKPAA